MSSSLCLHIFLLCFLVHACNARRLVFVTNQSTENEVNIPRKQDDEINNLGKSDPKSLVVVHEVQRQTQEDFNGIPETKKGAVTMKQKLINAFFKAKEGISRAITGYEIVNSSEDDLRKTAKIKVWRRHGRSMLGPSRVAEATVDSEENNAVEDIVEMDYAQPHKKPPIHNEKP
ncbi:hypothetical protein SLA2020_499280 [Shorea laevis]